MSSKQYRWSEFIKREVIFAWMRWAMQNLWTAWFLLHVQAGILQAASELGKYCIVHLRCPKWRWVRRENYYYREVSLFPGFPNYELSYSNWVQDKLSSQSKLFFPVNWVPFFLPVLCNFPSMLLVIFCTAFHPLFGCTWPSLWVQQVIHTQSMPPGLGSAQGIPDSLQMWHQDLLSHHNTEGAEVVIPPKKYKLRGMLASWAIPELQLLKASGHLHEKSTCTTVWGPEFIYKSVSECI